MSLVSNELAYKKEVYSHPIYDLTKTPPLEGTQSFSVSPSGGNVLTFEIPATGFNLAKSYLNFTVTPAATPANFNFIVADTIPFIREIQLQTKGGLILSYIPNLDVYLKSVLKPETSLQDFLALDLYSSNNAAVIGATNGLQRSDDLKGATGAASNARRYADVIASATSANLSYTEPKYVFYDSASAANAATPVIPVKLPLSLIYNSIFALDKTILLNEIIQLRIVFNSCNRFGWTTATQFSPGAAQTPLTAAAISSPFLFVAMEKNPEVIMSLQQKVNSPEGLSMLLDYVYVNRQTFSASTLQSMTLKYTRNNGIRLKKVYYCLTPAAETGAATFDISNINGSKVVSYYDTLNNQRLVSYNIDCSASALEDWMYHKSLLRGSVLQTANIYQYNWVSIRCFEDIISPIEEGLLPGHPQNLIQGLPLDQEQKYDWIGNTTNNGYNHYAFSICSKILVVSSSGIQLM